MHIVNLFRSPWLLTLKRPRIIVVCSDFYFIFLHCLNVYQNEDRVLWKLGTLPPGLITFYGLTHPLEKSWHVLGLGYNPSVDKREIEHAAVIHYNGNMKPWLELAMTKYRPYWTKYIKYDHPYLRSCNLSEWTWLSVTFHFFALLLSLSQIVFSSL